MYNPQISSGLVESNHTHVTLNCATTAAVAGNAFCVQRNAPVLESTGVPDGQVSEKVARHELFDVTENPNAPLAAYKYGHMTSSVAEPVTVK